MDIFDEVLNLEQIAYEQGLEIGKARVDALVKEKSFLEGKENGFYIAKEYGFILGYAQIVNHEEHIREQHYKVIQSILHFEITPDMPGEQINSKIRELRLLYKHLLSLLKLKAPSTSSSELF